MLKGRLKTALRPLLDAVRYLPFALGRPPSPRSATIDPISRCNLRCPLCPTGRGHASSPGKGILSRDLYLRALDQLPKLECLRLFNWGESLQHPEILDFIRIASERDIRVHVHSNLSIKKDPAFFDGLVRSGLDSLFVSLDGASAETYARYRVGGDFDLVVANIERIQAAKQRISSRHPRVIWKFIIHRDNAHEVDAARRHAESLGVEFTTDTIGLADDLPDYDMAEPIEVRRAEWLPEDPALRAAEYRSETPPPPTNKCHQLFQTTVITPNGDVMPCCYASHPGNAFGNLNESSFQEIWSGAQYRYSRSLFVRPLARRAKSSVTKNLCTRCPNFKQRNRTTRRAGSATRKI
jgi:radical SAM protein with 4Fe4S-binding SPASM domain